jgi:peroxiredoxin Q/BCP
MKKLIDFKLDGIDSQGIEKTYTKADFIGKNLVVYFYPKDNTPGCTKEACNFNAILPQISALANIIGVSADDIKSHKKFREDHSLAFPLISDCKLELATSLGATKKSDIISKLIMETFENKKITRSTFIINDQGVVVKEWPSVTVNGHDTEVLAELKKLSKL